MQSPDHVWHLAGDYEGFRVERYGKETVLLDAEGKTLRRHSFLTEDGARRDVFDLVSDAYNGRIH
jgi:hypothetical protein